jgi:hypothetical protein
VVISVPPKEIFSLAFNKAFTAYFIEQYWHSPGKKSSGKYSLNLTLLNASL